MTVEREDEAKQKRRAMGRLIGRATRSGDDWVMRRMRGTG